jgi:hypothetical protein
VGFEFGGAVSGGVLRLNPLADVGSETGQPLGGGFAEQAQDFRAGVGDQNLAADFEQAFQAVPLIAHDGGAASGCFE